MPQIFFRNIFNINYCVKWYHRQIFLALRTGECADGNKNVCINICSLFWNYKSTSKCVNVFFNHPENKYIAIILHLPVYKVDILIFPPIFPIFSFDILPYSVNHYLSYFSIQVCVLFFLGFPYHCTLCQAVSFRPLHVSLPR